MQKLLFDMPNLPPGEIPIKGLSRLLNEPKLRFESLDDPFIFFSKTGEIFLDLFRIGDLSLIYKNDFK